MAEDKKPASPASPEKAAETSPKEATAGARKFTENDYKILQKLNRELIAMGKHTEELNASYERFIDGITDEAAFASMNAMEDAIARANESLTDTIKHLKNIQIEYEFIAKKGDASVSPEERRKLAAKEAAKAVASITSGYDKLLDDAKGLEDLGHKDLENIIKKAQKEKQRLQDAKELSGVQGDEALAYDQAALAAVELLNKAKKRLELEDQVTKKLGLTGAILKGTQGLLSKFGLDKFLDLDETNKKLRDMAKGGSSPFEIMKSGAEDVGASLMKAVKDPLVVVGLLVSAIKSIATAALHYQTKMFEAAKNLGVNVGQAEKMMHHFKDIAASNSKMALDAEQLSKTYSEMSNNLGVMVNQDEEFMAQSAAISRNFGLSAQQMELMQLRAKQTGKSVKETFGDIVGTGKAMAQSLGISMTEKQIMEGISKTSATVFMNFKGNVQQLTEAVVKATKFGVTLEQINSAGNSMLDFQSSISKEFEAQLLTGKNINLEKAREYALTGQTDKLMGEITRNLGDQNSWSKMNVLQQQSLAEAMGMSKEQVDEMYRKQTLINVLGKDANLSETERYQKLVEQKKSRAEIAKLMGEEAVARATEASAQQQMEASMKNLSEFAGSLAAAFLPITWTVEKIAEGINAISKSGTVVKVIFGAIGAALAGILVYMTAMAVKTKIQAVADARKLTSLQLEKLLKEQAAAADQKSAIATATSANNSTREVATEAAVLPSKIAGAAADGVSAGAAAGAAVAGPTLGFGSIPMILAVAGSVLSMVAMFGGLSGFGGGGGGAASTAMPVTTGGASQQSMTPMNPYSAAARTQNMVGIGANGAPVMNVNVQTDMDPITAKSTTTVEMGSNGYDGGTGSNPAAKTVKKTGGN